MSQRDVSEPVPSARDAALDTSRAHSAHGEVAGFFLLGLVQAFYNLKTLRQGGMTLDIGKISPEKWYPFPLLIDILCGIEKGFSTSDSLFFRAGTHFLRVWYDYGPGKTMIHSSLDWLQALCRFQWNLLSIPVACNALFARRGWAQRVRRQLL